MSTAEPLTTVELIFYRDQLERWLRFGRDVDERMIDRRRRIVAFAPNSVFAFVRWEGNEHGTILSRIDILRACGSDEPFSTVPGVAPGGEILLRLAGWPRVKRVFETVAAIENAGIDPTEVAPDYWRHVHNRIATGQSPRPYEPSQHCAWLLRRRSAA